MNKHRGPPAWAAGHRKNRGAVPLRPVLSISKGCSDAQLLRCRVAVELMVFASRKRGFSSARKSLTTPHDTTIADNHDNYAAMSLQDRGILGTKTTRLFRRFEEETGHPRPCPVLRAGLSEAARGPSDSDDEDSERKPKYDSDCKSC